MCVYFNSDKGEKFKNQYAKPSKQEDKKNIAHGYAKIYEKYLEEHKDEYLNIRNDLLRFLKIGKNYY